MTNGQREAVLGKRKWWGVKLSRCGLTGSRSRWRSRLVMLTPSLLRPSPSSRSWSWTPHPHPLMMHELLGSRCCTGPSSYPFVCLFFLWRCLREVRIIHIRGFLVSCRSSRFFKKSFLPVLLLRSMASVYFGDLRNKALPLIQWKSLCRSRVTAEQGSNSRPSGYEFLTTRLL